MVSHTTQEITVDRVSNSGNAIAEEQYDGKTVHVPAGTVGQTYEVRLRDKGSYLSAELIDTREETQPRQPSITNGPDTSDVASDLVNPGQDSTHNFEVRDSPANNQLHGTPESDGQSRRSWMNRRKL